MEIALGFAVALIIGLTGVGGGSITTPVLFLMMGVPTAEAVGIALIFAAAVKITSAPVFLFRGHVDKRTLGLMLTTGVPGVLLGAMLLRGMEESLMNTFVGLTIVSIAVINMFRLNAVVRHERMGILVGLSFIIGLEMGFSSAGAGALGALMMMSLTKLEPSTLVGTNLCYGLVLSVVGGGIHASAGHMDMGLLTGLLMGGIPGAIAGSLLASKVPAKKYKAALSLLLIFLGGQLAWAGISAAL